MLLMPKTDRKARLFVVSFNNGKKRRPNTPYRDYEANGVQFPSGHVVIDTDVVRPDYASVESLQANLGQWGTCEVRWLDEPEEQDVAS